jgi:hypothetical protein
MNKHHYCPVPHKKISIETAELSPFICKNQYIKIKLSNIHNLEYVKTDSQTRNVL